ncbi:MAG: DUF3667 domain-containing protein [Rhodocyclaceae bacterium]|jgi:hypothetical protein|nr:DUF3667 domain-containing protein [Rhodocyclaceae bacterium]MCA3017206.1 DUF3667 domain-containing protein [Rhodocyclaceae bacterium]MCA3022680.1 DUF3667 domain-containing protein [Rhodocyclaceae bacterium]MCA3026012.1 DUF3667 domain-containing protein [Rhodocyclaceae bacterium]MCA3027874.1 DUF3667 domain-containing protein [Rhodocyclaceae bacterium]
MATTDSVTASADPAAVTHRCRNCGFSFEPISPAPKYCPQCGQDTHLHAPSAWEFIHEFITHYVALEGKLWKTLILLFCLPGELSRRFRDGKKVAYVHPLRLYLTASFIFFLVVKVAGFGNIVQLNQLAETKGQQVLASGKTSNVPPDEALKGRAKVEMDCEPGARFCQMWQGHVKEKWEGKTVGDVFETIKKSVISNLPYAMFFMLPVFATLTFWSYRRRNLAFGEHMVYAMHVHAFAYFALLGKALLPPKIGDMLLLVFVIYFFIAMQRYFGGRWWATALRCAVISTFYPLLLVALTGGIIIFSILI